MRFMLAAAMPSRMGDKFMKLSTAWKHTLRDAYKEPNVFLTMNFNRQIGFERMNAYAKAFFARADRRIIGRNFIKRPEERIDCIGVIESPDTNPHIHWFGLLPVPALNDYTADIYSEGFTREFKAVVPSGTIDVRPVWNKRRLSGYISKQLRHFERSDRVLFTRDYWPSNGVFNGAKNR